MKYAQAFSPGHVTGLFSISEEDPDPLRRGSLGAGFCTDLGVTTQVFLEDGKEDLFVLNDNPTFDTPVSRTVVRHFLHDTQVKKNGTLRIHHNTSLPLGSGFGTSGAGALSLALALNNLYGDPLSFFEAAQIAHRAELENHTGLGTVIGETFGGFEIRIAPGAPGYGRVKNFNFDKSLRAVFLVFGPYSTPGMLKNPQIRDKVNSAGVALREQLIQNATVENFLKLSLQFTLKTGLSTPLIHTLLESLARKGVTAGMLMFGEGIYSVLNPEQEVLFRNTVQPYVGKGNLFSCGIDPEGGRLVQID